LRLVVSIVVQRQQTCQSPLFKHTKGIRCFASAQDDSAFFYILTAIDV